MTWERRRLARLKRLVETTSTWKIMPLPTQRVRKLRRNQTEAGSAEFVQFKLCGF
jgi:hypothetical protein